MATYDAFEEGTASAHGSSGFALQPPITFAAGVVLDSSREAAYEVGGGGALQMKSRHSLGATARIFFDLLNAGVGVGGQAPTVAIQRVADSKWFQWSDETWQDTIVENLMAELDSVNLPGRYYFDFDQSQDGLVASTVYVAKKTNAGEPIASEYEDLTFGPMAGAIAASLCSVQGSIADAQGAPLQNILVRAVLVPIFSDALGRAVQSDRVVSTHTNELGDFDLPLVQGGIFRLEIPEVGYDRKVTIPTAPSVIFTDL
jgi:hypothetical protein